jgi:hypothetical protein
MEPVSEPAVAEMSRPVPARTALSIWSDHLDFFPAVMLRKHWLQKNDPEGSARI